MKKKLKELRGDFTINGALIILLVVAVLILTISTIGVANQGMRVHNIATELSRYIELRGRVDNAVYTELERLEQSSGISLTCNIDAQYIPGTQKIQFGDVFTVTLSCTGKIGLGGVVSISVPLRSVVSGRSEQYWQ